MIEPTPLSDLVADDLLLDRLGSRADCGYDPLASVLGALAAHADTPLRRGPVRRGGRHRLFTTFAVLAVGASGAGVAAAVTLPDRLESPAHVAPVAPARPGRAPGLTVAPAARPLALPAGGQGSWQFLPQAAGSVAHTASVGATLGLAVTRALTVSGSALSLDLLAAPVVAPGVSDVSSEGDEPLAPKGPDGSKADRPADHPGGPAGPGNGPTGPDTGLTGDTTDDTTGDITSGEEGPVRGGPRTEPTTPTTKPTTKPTTEPTIEPTIEDESRPTASAPLAIAPHPEKESHPDSAVAPGTTIAALVATPASVSPPRPADGPAATPPRRPTKAPQGKPEEPGAPQSAPDDPGSEETTGPEIGSPQTTGPQPKPERACVHGTDALRTPEDNGSESRREEAEVPELPTPELPTPEGTPVDVPAHTAPEATPSAQVVPPAVP